MCRFLPLTETTPLVTSLAGKHGFSNWSSASVYIEAPIAYTGHKWNAGQTWAAQPEQHEWPTLQHWNVNQRATNYLIYATIILYKQPRFGGVVVSCSVGSLCFELADFSLHEETFRNVSERRRKGFKGCERNSSHPPSLFQDWSIQFCYLVKRKWTISTKRSLFKSGEVVQCI